MVAPGAVLRLCLQLVLRESPVRIQRSSSRTWKMGRCSANWPVVLGEWGIVTRREHHESRKSGSWSWSGPMQVQPLRVAAPRGFRPSVFAVCCEPPEASFPCACGVGSIFLGLPGCNEVLDITMRSVVQPATCSCPAALPTGRRSPLCMCAR